MANALIGMNSCAGSAEGLTFSTVHDGMPQAWVSNTCWPS
ncbi:hypothetical protein BSU04_24910 [Caballeronia sordidicola]|uniref:Uncharacterized protein n=1 Tax=Caballeronia sordidicola TaxID=196367 RepID=A0A226WXR0_CABSO|nr:hypothetical protein BSU04_24910 [Caballeronia sordidicola]